MSRFWQCDEEATASSEHETPPVLWNAEISHLKDVPVGVVAERAQSSDKRVQQRATVQSEARYVLHHDDLWACLFNQSGHL